MNYIYSFLIGYILGSFPTAFILLKTARGIDITKSGSGNVGAMNSLKVSNSKKLALIVLIIDALKGWIPAYLIYNYISNDFIFPALGLTAAILGHCFSPWLNFKGGRGIATAAGGALFITIPTLLFWASVWLLTFLFQRNIHLGNIMASIFSILASIIIPNSLIQYSSLQPSNVLYFAVLISIMMIIIISRHSSDIHPKIIIPLHNLFRSVISASYLHKLFTISRSTTNEMKGKQK
jgi:acyl phosphate:glycerol-3-phosphate acyltransferase